MGIGAEAMKLYEELTILSGGQSICELGSQDMQCDGHWWTPARDYYEDLGLRYVCIDLDGRHGALRLNLNSASIWDVLEPGDERFDLVTNHGTSEHCFNQHNCFKLMHDLTKPGGLMIHLVPSKPWQHSDDSFYYYSASLFADLAEANGYEVIRLEYVQGTVGSMVQAVLRRVYRRGNDAFRAPIQRDYQAGAEHAVAVPERPPEPEPSPDSVALTPETANLGVEG